MLKHHWLPQLYVITTIETLLIISLRAHMLVVYDGAKNHFHLPLRMLYTLFLLIDSLK